MLKIISRPPFDEHSMQLFYMLYVKRNQYGLNNASFVYLWTGTLSIDGIFGCSNEVLTSFSPLQLPNFIKFITVYSDMIAGKNRFFADRDEMYQLYCEYSKTSAPREEFDKYYTQYAENVLDRGAIEDLLQEVYVNDIVVLFVKDHFRANVETSWDKKIPELSTYFSNMCEFYPDKKFIIVTSLENLDKEIQRENCLIVNMGGDITNQINSYMKYTPVVNKMGTKNFIALNRGARYHRIYLVASLYSRNLDKHGQISFLSHISEYTTQLSDLVKYDHKNDLQYEFTNIGFRRFLEETKNIDKDSFDIYHGRQNDNLSNFKNDLQDKYVNSYIEFVSETSYGEHSFNITEKTLHFIYGCNYPIMISSPGTVKFLRNIGIDMFDDFIDHSYDDIEDPASRITRAIDLNIDILTMDLDILDKRWNRDKYRMEQNISFVQTKLANFYKKRFWEQIKGLPL